MKISSELINDVINQKQKCIIHGNYAILTKQFCVPDMEVSDFVNKNNLLSSDLSIPRIYDYQFLSEPNFDNPRIYTKAIQIQDKAQGFCIGDNESYFPLDRNETLINKIKKYILAKEKYLKEFLIVSNASLSQLSKYLNDYEVLTSNFLPPDPKPLNIFYDKENGFTIIDIISSKNNKNDYILEEYLMGIIGYGLPYFGNDIYLTNEEYLIYFQGIENLKNKLRVVFSNYSNLKVDDVFKRLDSNLSSITRISNEEILENVELKLQEKEKNSFLSSSMW